MMDEEKKDYAGEPETVPVTETAEPDPDTGKDPGTDGSPAPEPVSGETGDPGKEPEGGNGESPADGEEPAPEEGPEPERTAEPEEPEKAEETETAEETDHTEETGNTSGTEEPEMTEGPEDGSAEDTVPAAASEEPVPAKVRKDPDIARIERTVKVTRTVNFVLMGVLLCVVLALGALVFLAANGYLYGKVLGDPAKGQIDGAAVASQSMPAIVMIENATSTGSSLGTGFLFREDGYILTNAHVMENSLSVQVEFRDGRKMDAKLVGMRTLEDVAVLKIEGSGYPTLPIGNSNEVMAGESVVAIGTAGGKQYAFTVTRGIVSYPNREVRVYDSTGKLSKRATMVQFDANATNGNSGGPLINARGQVIGIVTMKANATSVDYLNMAIPITGAVELAEAIIAGGDQAEQATSDLAEGRPLIGVTAYTYGVQTDSRYFLINNEDGTISPVMLVTEEEGGEPRYYYYSAEPKEGDQAEPETGDSRYAGYYRIYVDPTMVFIPGADGVLILSVTEGFDAMGKLQALDIVLSIDGKKVSSVTEVSAIINEHRGGDTVSVRFYREGAGEQTVQITLGTEK